MSLIESHTRLLARVAELERKVAGMVRQGVAEEVDAAKHTVRLKLGDGADGKPFLSPKRPYSQSAGALKGHIPPVKGQPMLMLCPNGDFNQGVCFPSTWSDANPSPSDEPDENVVTLGPYRITFKGDVLEIAGPKVRVVAGGVTHEITSSGVTTTGGTIKHDGKNVGSTHKHGGIEPGGGLTATPE